MIPQKDKDFISKCLTLLYEKREPSGNVLPAKEPPYEIEDGGVPLEMFAGEISEEGWVKWQILESDLKISELEELESKYHIKFPNLFRAYLTTKFHLFEQFRNSDFKIMLPPVPSDNPFGEISTILENGKFLITHGYIPFGYYEDQWGIICFDTQKEISDEDYPIVWFDHEVVNEGMDKKTLESNAVFLYLSFRKLLEDCFL